MIELSAGEYRLALAPERGGSILDFRWRGEALMRPVCGPSILDVACFPLVPFSNRIAHGRFVADGRVIRLSPNFPGADHPHPLHGFGWLAQWDVLDRSASSAMLEHRHSGAEWPWPYQAEQRISLDERGLLLQLSVANLGGSPMPAGLGFHPYFPCNAVMRYRGLHRGEWTTSAEGLPVSLGLRNESLDWWQGLPADQRNVDTVYVGREGPLSLVWPDRRLAVTIEPSSLLDYTAVYIPAGASFMCVEPVSHATNAINRAPGAGRMTMLPPGKRIEASVRFTASGWEEGPESRSSVPRGQEVP